MHFLRLLLAAAAAALCATGNAVAQSKPTVGILFKNRVGYWALAERGAVVAGEELGLNVVVKGPPSVENPSWQLTLLRALADQKIDVLVISPTRLELLEPEVKQVIAHGTKIVSFDAAAWENLVTVSIEPDRVGIAKAAAAVFVKSLGETDEVLVFRNNQSDIPVVEREQLLIQEIKALRPNLIIRADIYANSSGSDAVTSAGFALTKYPQIKAVISTSTNGTMAMLETLQTRNLAGKIKLVGFGTNLDPKAAQALEAGAMEGWVAQLPFDTGRLCVTTAAALIRGEKVPPVVKEQPLVVTRDNLHDAKVQALLKL
jgi:ribose transport system substrate-binding protein